MGVPNTVTLTVGSQGPGSQSRLSLPQVMDNVLAQVSGRKRVVLYSPRDALHLYLSGELRSWFLVLSSMQVTEVLPS